MDSMSTNYGQERRRHGRDYEGVNAMGARRGQVVAMAEAVRLKWFEHLLARRMIGVSKSFQFKRGALAPITASLHSHTAQF